MTSGLLCGFCWGTRSLNKELESISVTPEPGGFRIAGVPKGMGQRVKALILVTDPAGRIGKIRLEEIDGASTEFDFDHSEENLPLPDDDFRYAPPAGVGVVDGLPPV